jgi:hypothetical protein
VTNSRHDPTHQAAGFGILKGAKPEGVEDGDRTGAHGENIPEDPADAGCCSLKGFYGGGMVMGLNLKGEADAVAEIHDPGIFAGTH